MWGGNKALFQVRLDIYAKWLPSVKFGLQPLIRDNYT